VEQRAVNTEPRAIELQFKGQDEQRTEIETQTLSGINSARARARAPVIIDESDMLLHRFKHFLEDNLATRLPACRVESGRS